MAEPPAEVQREFAEELERWAEGYEARLEELLSTEEPSEAVEAQALAPELERVAVARAIITIGGKVLLARGRGESFYHLPGGHVEAGEAPADCCLRELREELGREVADLRPVATFENHYTTRDGRDVAETNHVYAVKLYPGLQEEPGRSREAHLTVEWVPIAELRQDRVMPPAMIDLIRQVGGL